MYSTLVWKKGVLVIGSLWGIMWLATIMANDLGSPWNK